MKSVKLLVILLAGLKGEISDKTRSDSYLEAYMDGQTFTNNAQKLSLKSDREYINPGFSYPASQSQYGTPLGPPSEAPLGLPKYEYGLSATNMYNYGPPVPAYSFPLQPLQPVYGNPHGMLSILDKIKWKLDLFTIGKILLKLVIFKKIVSLIAILCLLLFIPTLKHKEDSSNDDGGDDGDDKRRLLKSFERPGPNGLNNVTTFVLEALEKFAEVHEENGSTSKTKIYVK